MSHILTPDSIAAAAQQAEAQKRRMEKLGEDLYLAALSGCVAADFARALSGISEGDLQGNQVQLKLQPQLIAQAAVNYAKAGFQALMQVPQQKAG